MKSIHKNKIALTLLLLALFIVNNATSLVFVTSLRNYLANLAANYKLKFTDDVQHETEQPSSTCSVRIEEGPNGTKNIFIYAKITINVEAHTSGSVFDATTYARYILMWEILRNTYKLMCDIFTVLAERILYILCFFTLLQSQISKRLKTIV